MFIVDKKFISSMLLENMSVYNSYLSPIQNNFVTSIINSSRMLTSTRIFGLEFKLYLCYN